MIDLQNASQKRTIRNRIFGVPQREITFERRGFAKTKPQIQEYLEGVGESFLHGYHHALDLRDPQVLATNLEKWPTPSTIGFVYEGAGMGLALIDRLSFRSDVIDSFVAGPGNGHIYMVYIGAGWAAAKLPWVNFNMRSYLRRFDPVLKWLVVDGYGFHQGYFAPRKYIDQRVVPRQMKGYARRAFDQGIGRCMWFVFGTNITLVSNAIRKFDSSRHADLWSGLGLACGYAGGVSEEKILQLLEAGREFQPEIAQGVAFAAKARIRAGNLVPHTDEACEIICNCSAQQAANITDECIQEITSSDDHAYEVWRCKIQRQLTQKTLPKKQQSAAATNSNIA